MVQRWIRYLGIQGLSFRKVDIPDAGEEPLRPFLGNLHQKCLNTSMTIKKRLFSLAVVAPLFIVIAILSALMGFLAIKKDIDAGSLVHDEVVHLQGAIIGLSDFVITQGHPDSAQKTKENLTAALKTYNMFLKTLEGSESHAEVTKKFSAQLTSVKEGIESFLKIQRDAIDDEAMIKYGKLTVQIDSMLSEFHTIGERYREEADNKKKKTFVFVAAVFLLALTALTFMFGATYRSITRQLKRSEESISTIQEGDLTRKVDCAGNDEIAALGRAINAMVSHLKDMIFRIQGITETVSSASSTITHASSKVLGSVNTQKEAVKETASAIGSMNESIASIADKSGSLSVLSEDTASSIAQMDASIKRIAESASIFNESAEETASSIEEMISAVKQIAGNLEHLIISSEETATAMSELSASVREIEQSAAESVGLAEKVDREASDKGMRSLNAATDGMNMIRENVRELAQTIKSLGKRSEDIGGILEVINEITDQTTLLALNAAILAAQAGEHGRGFSVVADQINSLADRTAAYTQEISKLIARVQEEIRGSIRMTDKSIHSVENGLALFKDLSKALVSIRSSSQTSTEMAKIIQKAAQEEVKTITLVNNTIQNMREGIKQIGYAVSEQHKGSQYIIEAAERMKDVSFQVKNATSEQTEGSKKITEAISSVSRQASEIAESTDGQKQKSNDIVNAIGMIHKTIGELIDSSGNLDSLIKSLKDEAQNLRGEIHKFKV